MTLKTVDDRRTATTQFNLADGLHYQRLNEAEEFRRREKHSNDSGTEKETGALNASIQWLRATTLSLRTRVEQFDLHAEWTPHVAGNIKQHRELSSGECFHEAVKQASMHASPLEESLSQYGELLRLERRKKLTTRIIVASIVVAVVVLIIVAVTIVVGAIVDANKANQQRLKGTEESAHARASATAYKATLAAFPTGTPDIKNLLVISNAGQATQSSSGLLDGYSLTFASDREGTFDTYLMDPQGGSWKKLNRPPGYDVAIWPSFCGNQIAVELHDTQGISTQSVYLLDPDSAKAAPLHASGDASRLGVPRCSPDGQFIAYSEYLNNKWQMKIDTFPQADDKLTISNDPLAGYASWFWHTRDFLYMAYRAGTFRILRINGMDQNQTSDISPARTQQGDTIDQWEYPAISPDGSQMAFVCHIGSEYWLCVTNSSTGVTDALQKIQIVKTRWAQWSIISAGTPVWSGDGTWIYFSSADSGNFDIYRIHPDGSGKEDLTNFTSNEIMPNTR